MNESGNGKKTPLNPTKKKIGFKKIFLFAVHIFKVIIVIGVIGLIFFNWQQQNIINELRISQNQLIDENENFVSQLQDFQQTFENINNSDASAEILLNQQNSRLDNLNAEMISLRLGLNANQASGNWQIAEATSLLRLAKQYLELVQEIPIALSLYQNSNAILAQIEDPALDRIKSLLASDIRNLSDSRSIDTEGFYMRLSDLSQQLDNISLGTFIEPSSAFREASAENNGFSNSLKEFLSRYFTVRRLEAPVTLPLNNQQISFLRQNMQLQIEQAKLALLQKRQSVYQDSISALLMLAQQNIPEQDQQKAYIIRSLRELQGETIVLNLVGLSDSLGLLESLMSELSAVQSN